MKDKFFLDTNIIVYAFEPSLEDKKKVSDKLIKNALSGRGCVSFQVIQEFLNVVTKKFRIPLKIEDIQLHLEKIIYPICEIFPTKELYVSALDINQRWQFSFYDSLIIAAAHEANCSILYSEDLQHNQKINDLTVTNPFL